MYSVRASGRGQNFVGLLFIAHSHVSIHTPAHFSPLFWARAAELVNHHCGALLKALGLTSFPKNVCTAACGDWVRGLRNWRYRFTVSFTSHVTSGKTLSRCLGFLISKMGFWCYKWIYSCKTLLLEPCVAHSKKASSIKVKCERAHFVYGSGFRLLFRVRNVLAFQLMGLWVGGEVKSGLVWAQCSNRGDSVDWIGAMHLIKVFWWNIWVIKKHTKKSVFYQGYITIKCFSFEMRLRLTRSSKSLLEELIYQSAWICLHIEAPRTVLDCSLTVSFLYTWTRHWRRAQLKMDVLLIWKVMTMTNETS